VSEVPQGRVENVAFFFALPNALPTVCWKLSGVNVRGPHPTPSHLQSTAISPGKILGNVLLAPRRIPIGVQNVADDAAPPQLGASGPYVAGSTGSGDTNEILKLDWQRSETSTSSSTAASSQGTTIA